MKLAFALLCVSAAVFMLRFLRALLMEGKVRRGDPQELISRNLIQLSDAEN
jgi:hypothetical protein